MMGGGEPGAGGRGSVLASQASHSGLWRYPMKGLGSLARLRWGLSGLRGWGGVALDGSGHQTWIMKQIKTSATNRSWQHTTLGAITISPFTVMKEVNSTAFTHS